jgi:hypothetical protein
LISDGIAKLLTTGVFGSPVIDTTLLNLVNKAHQSVAAMIENEREIMALSNRPVRAFTFFKSWIMTALQYRP